MRTETPGQGQFGKQGDGIRLAMQVICGLVSRGRGTNAGTPWEIQEVFHVFRNMSDGTLCVGLKVEDERNVAGSAVMIAFASACPAAQNGRRKQNGPEQLWRLQVECLRCLVVAQSSSVSESQSLSLRKAATERIMLPLFPLHRRPSQARARCTLTSLRPQTGLCPPCAVCRYRLFLSLASQVFPLSNPLLYPPRDVSPLTPKPAFFAAQPPT